MADYIAAEEAEEIKEELMESEHSRLKGLRIKCLFKEGAPLKSQGALVYAKIRKVTGVLGFFSQADFIIEISLELWDDLEIKAQTALIDHELCHIVQIPGQDGKTTWGLQPHDIEEFFVIMERYGCYLKGMDRLKNIDWNSKDGKWSK